MVIINREGSSPKAGCHLLAFRQLISKFSSILPPFSSLIQVQLTCNMLLVSYVQPLESPIHRLPPLFLVLSTSPTPLVHSCCPLGQSDFSDHHLRENQERKWRKRERKEDRRERATKKKEKGLLDIGAHSGCTSPSFPMCGPSLGNIYLHSLSPFLSKLTSSHQPN